MKRQHNTALIALLGTILLKENEWKQVLKHVKYTGDYYFVNAKELNLISKK